MSAERRATLGEQLASLRAGTVTSVGLVRDALHRLETVDLGMVQTRFDDRALAAAAEADPASPLAGVPLVVKDLIATADAPTTGGSLVRDPAWSAAVDAPAVARLRGAGAVILAKTTTSELGVGSPDPDKPFPVPRNPWNPECWTGGSSAGTAAAIASGVVSGGLGTDSGGSIRMPAAFCGVTGLKPTYGLVPTRQCVPMGWSTDHLGPMAVSARDCALLLAVLAGRPLVRSWPGELRGIRIGVDRMERVGGAVADAAQPRVFAAALDVLADRGATLVDLELPYYDELSAAAVVTTLSEAFAVHSAGFRTRWADYFANTRATVGLAAFFTSADYVQAQRVRALAHDAMAGVWEQVDLVAMPTAAVAATPYERLGKLFESGEFFAIYSTYWNMLGNPALSVPIGFTGQGLPLGMQLVGPARRDDVVLRAGDDYQHVTDWHLRLPPAAPSDPPPPPRDGGFRGTGMG